MNGDKPYLKRVLGFRDLSFFLIAALVNLNSVPVVASAGPVALILWLSGFVFFFIPQAIAVLEFSKRSPHEGGIYNWNKAAWGDFHGFISGWAYWVNNIFYIPTLLFYIIGFLAYIIGNSTSSLSSSPVLMMSISLGLLWILTYLNIRGFGVGKWVQNLGASGTFITASTILVIGIITASTKGSSVTFSMSSVFSSLDNWTFLSLLSVVCLNYVGLELGSVIADEVKEPQKNIPKAVLVAGTSTILMFLVVTTALLISIPFEEIGIIEGILQGIERAAEAIGIGWIVFPVAVFMIMNAAGNTSAWLSGAARIPFVIGIDRYLPSALGTVHPKHNTPHVALIVQGVASSFVIIVAAIGSSVGDMYMFLLQTTVVLQLIPYVYMFAALIKVRSTYGKSGGFFSNKFVTVIAGFIGGGMTIFGIAFAFVPSANISAILVYEIKLVFSCVSFLIPAFVFYRINLRKLKVSEVIN
ncbi:MAG: amino acid permease [Ignavibacteriaceae bacterium]|nr:amino acid permease [Ignavibacteriaceae bacterium]